jgi:hypothetical protein
VRQARPQRVTKAIVRLQDEPAPAKPAPKAQPTADAAPRQQVLVPSAIWPRYNGEENGGEGWSAEIVRETA